MVGEKEDFILSSKLNTVSLLRFCLIINVFGVTLLLKLSFTPLASGPTKDDAVDMRTAAVELSNVEEEVEDSICKAEVIGSTA